MKKYFYGILTLVVLCVFGFYACNDKESPDSNDDKTTETSDLLAVQAAHFGHTIGVQNSGANTITYDMTLLKSQFEAHLEEGNIFSDLTNFRIEMFSDEQVDYYLLLADDSDGLSRSAVKLVLDGGDFFEAIINQGGSSVNCKGCTKGCTPRKKINGDGWCTSCDESIGTLNNCTKSETLSLSSIFY